ncbi:ankyrin repeat domain-containing protein [Kordiimonas sp.]|uniref:ankyrin repeat domain-containing protein n=1 Tax=Kordiimonas sp. TaxID=1970157 RepID=UPI003A92C136
MGRVPSRKTNRKTQSSQKTAALVESVRRIKAETYDDDGATIFDQLSTIYDPVADRRKSNDFISAIREHIRNLEQEGLSEQRRLEIESQLSSAKTNWLNYFLTHTKNGNLTGNDWKLERYIDIYGRRQSKRYATVQSASNWLSPKNESFIPFVGRDCEIAELNAFAGTCEGLGHNFKLWAIVGPSGAGKTRLLIHWANSDVLEGWQAIDINSTTKITWSAWVPECPTLISIDYIYGYDQVVADIVARAMEYQFRHPVRLLILDHSTPGSMADLLKDPRWGFESRRSEDFATIEDEFLFRETPLALQIPKNDETVLTAIICSVSGKIKNHPAVQEGLAYLNANPAARQPLFAALVGEAILRGRSYHSLNRRELIRLYLRGATRLTWLLDGPDAIWAKGAWVACFVAAATMLGGAAYKDLMHGVEGKDSADIRKDFKNFRALCRSVTASTGDSRLDAFQPDILGETHFLLLLEEIEKNRHEFDGVLQSLVSAGATGKKDTAPIEFIGFIKRLAQNLLNDKLPDEDLSAYESIDSYRKAKTDAEQVYEQSRSYWKSLLAFLSPAKFALGSPMRWAVNASLVEIVKAIRQVGGGHRIAVVSDQVIAQINVGDLCENIPDPARNVASLYAIDGFALKQGTIVKTPGIIPAKLISLLANDTLAQIPPLIHAACMHQQGLIEKLLVQGGDINQIDSNGMNALMITCAQGRDSDAVRLIALGADIGHQNSVGATVLMVALEFGCLHTARLLINRKVDLNKVLIDREGKKITALKLARSYNYGGYDEIVEALVDCGAVEYD